MSLVVSNKINRTYFGGNPEKIRASIIDISCSAFFQAQQNVPDISAGIGIGGRTKQSRRSKTKRRSMRNERNERNDINNSKKRNRISRTRRSRRTRKN